MREGNTGYDLGGRVAEEHADGCVPGRIDGAVAGGVGLWQINARVPQGITGQWPLFITAQNLASNAVTVSVH